MYNSDFPNQNNSNETAFDTIYEQKTLFVIDKQDISLNQEIKIFYEEEKFELENMTDKKQDINITDDVIRSTMHLNYDIYNEQNDTFEMDKQDIKVV